MLSELTAQMCLEELIATLYDIFYKSEKKQSSWLIF